MKNNRPSQFFVRAARAVPAIPGNLPPAGPASSPGPGPNSNQPNRTRRRFTFVGAGALIAVGYMDPGNWATALAGGAQYGYALLGVMALASLMGLLLQSLAARVGLVTGRDLAQLTRAHYSRRATLGLWIASEIAIIACDVAEVVGCAVALQLLLGVSLTVGVLLSACGTFALLALRRQGTRRLEGTVAALIFFVALCFVAQLALARPDWHAALGGLAPPPRLLQDAGMLWLAAGILGATVMPHNLYLHSALVKNLGVTGRASPAAGPASRQSSVARVSAAALRRALRGVNLDTLGSLTFAFVINAALLIVAAAVFHASGHTAVRDLGEAQRLLVPLLGSHLAGVLFAAALLACGLNSTVTGTLAGQVVMQGFLHLKMAPWQRAAFTRLLALGPALAAVAWFGARGSTQLLVASQVVLSLQLPLAVIPLVRFAADGSLMGRWRVSGAMRALAWACAGAILALNLVLVWQVLGG